MAMEIEATYDDMFVTKNGGKFISTSMKVLLCTDPYRNIIFPKKGIIFTNIYCHCCA